MMVGRRWIGSGGRDGFECFLGSGSPGPSDGDRGARVRARRF
jgi:hypothetical protein